jgi:hypothetical protein
VYGAPLAVYPGYFYDGWFGPPFISFGPAIRLGFFSGFGWGWPAWGFNWGRRVVIFNHNTYVSRSRYFFHRGPFIGARGVGTQRPIVPFVSGRSFSNRTRGTLNDRAANDWANRRPFASRTNNGPRTGVYNGARAGGIDRGTFSRGVSRGGGRSLGGSGFGGGGGGSRGGGGGRRHR